MQCLMVIYSLSLWRREMLKFSTLLPPTGRKSVLRQGHEKSAKLKVRPKFSSHNIIEQKTLRGK